MEQIGRHLDTRPKWAKDSFSNQEVLQAAKLGCSSWPKSFMVGSAIEPMKAESTLSYVVHLRSAPNYFRVSEVAYKKVSDANIELENRRSLRFIPWVDSS